MLKKAGIVVAVVTGGVLALSPLAFATSPDEHHDPHRDHHSRIDVEQASIERDNQDVDCDFANNQAVTGVGGLLGVSLGIPVNATIPLLSCNNVNVEDVIDVGTNNPSATVASTG